MRINFSNILFLPFFMLTMPIYGAANIESYMEDKYNLALKYRDGKEGIQKDTETAKQLFLDVVNETPDHAKALHNLGVIAHDKNSYEEARDYFVKGAALGLEASTRNLWKMQADEKIPASLKERFLAICDLNGYTLPVDRTTFNFNCKMGKCTNTGNMSIGGALYTKTLDNSGYLSFPVIWVENEKEFFNKGQINTQLLIVGKKRVSL